MSHAFRGVLLIGFLSGVRKPFVVEVVNKPCEGPRVHILAKAQRVRSHGRFDREHVFAERIARGPFVNERDGFGAGGQGHSRLVKGTRRALQQ